MSEHDIKALREQLAAHPLVAGDFSQLRTINGIPKPLSSNGRFMFWLGAGIYWETQEPFFSASTFTANDLIQWNSDFTPLQNTSQQGVVQKYMNEVIMAIFQADDQALQRYFDIIWKGNRSAWALELTPSTSAVRKAIDTITLQGDQFIRQVHIVSTQGDSTNVLFEHLTTAEHPNNEQCRRFYRQPTRTCATDGE